MLRLQSNTFMKLYTSENLLTCSSSIIGFGGSEGGLSNESHEKIEMLC